MTASCTHSERAPRVLPVAQEQTSLGHPSIAIAVDICRVLKGSIIVLAFDKIVRGLLRRETAIDDGHLGLFEIRARFCPYLCSSHRGTSNRGERVLSLRFSCVLNTLKNIQGGSL